MRFRQVIGYGLCAIAMVGLGCAAEEANPEDLGVALQGAGGDPGVGNHLEVRCVDDHGIQTDVRTMGNAALVDTGTNNLVSMPHMPSGLALGDLNGCRRTFLGMLVECALPEGESVTDPNDIVGWVNGTPIPKTYDGKLALAPYWTTQGLTTVEKEWVTACMMARTNRFGETIQILLQGNHPSLAYNPADSALYPYAESTVWGNMFDSTMSLTPDGNTYQPAPFAGHVCHNYDTGLCPDAAYRACDLGSACGFIPHGPCAIALNECATAPAPAYCISFGRRIKAYLQTEEAVCPAEFGTYDCSAC